MKPFWPNVCEHPDGTFVGNIVVRHSPTSNTYGDVYVYQASLGAEVCIRTGPEDGDYYSPGNLLDMAKRSHGNSVYRSATELIRERCSLTCVVKKTKERDSFTIKEAHREVRKLKDKNKHSKEDQNGW